MLFTVFDHRYRGNAGIRERLSQLFTLMKLDMAADGMKNIQLSGYSQGFFLYPFRSPRFFFRAGRVKAHAEYYSAKPAC